MIRFFRSLISFGRSFLSLAAPVAIIALHLGVMLCFINRWDALVTVTLIPIWIWSGIGMTLSLIGWVLLRSRLLILTFVIWLATGIFCADESPGLYRAFRAAFDAPANPASEPSENRLRVVTINCARGNLDAARSALSLDPDIVFLQEAPEDGAAIETLATEFFEGKGSVLKGGNSAILARGELTKIDIEGDPNSLMASLKTPDGRSIELFNLHLHRAIPRKDFWNPEAWQTFTQLRKTNRRNLRKMVEQFPDRPAAVPQIVGGDFGTPANDDLYRMLNSLGFADSFRNAGYGWGNTYTTGQPLLRIDQIWSSNQLRPVKSKAVSNKHSDHRMVVTDYERIEAGR